VKGKYEGEKKLDLSAVLKDETRLDLINISINAEP
jgi:hypothetical protein